MIFLIHPLDLNVKVRALAGSQSSGINSLTRITCVGVSLSRVLYSSTRKKALFAIHSIEYLFRLLVSLKLVRRSPYFSQLILSGMRLLSLHKILLVMGLASSDGFSPFQQLYRNHLRKLCCPLRTVPEGWQGDVVSGDGIIRGCTVTPVEGSLTEWTMAIDGVEADLGRFSDAIYKKFVLDAKQQRFQGFRPGTIPPHLEPTYRAYAMDECARETILEAMQQNSIRPFENCRGEMHLYNFCIPPPPVKTKAKTKKRAILVENSEEKDSVAAWKSFATMKEAIDAGWRPGQSFSFLADGIKGQKVKIAEPGATSFGLAST